MGFAYVINPMGQKVKFHCEDPKNWMAEVERDILPRWEDYCNSHWLSANHEDMYAPERRVKSFLDRCGTLMLYGQAGIESPYKAMMHTVREIAMTDCPAAIENLVYSSSSLTACADDASSEEARMAALMERLEERAKVKPKVNTRKAKKETMFDRACSL